MANQLARTLRTNQTDAEKKLWRELRLLKPLGFHFRRQVPIDRFIVDFACYSARIVIEVDGGQHNLRAGAEADEQRDADLQRYSYRVLRFWNNDVIGNLEGVMSEISNALSKKPPHPQPLPAKGRGLAAARSNGNKRQRATPAC